MKMISGMEEYQKYFTEKPWFYWHDVLEFKWYRDFDYITQSDRTYIEMTLTDISHNDVVRFKFTDIAMVKPYNFPQYISGFEISNADNGWESQYKVYDFEDEQICFYCKVLSLTVLKANNIYLDDSIRE